MFELRDYQAEAVRMVDEHWAKGLLRIMLCAPTGSGKCLARETEVLRFDGKVVPVETIEPGWDLMGPDGLPRRVLSTSVGHGPMARIIPVKGDPWECNLDHILTLVRTGEVDDPARRKRNRDGEVIDVSVKEWLGWSKWSKHIWKLHRAPVANFGVVKTVLQLPAYLVGLLLGDGDLTNRRVSVTTADQEIESYLRQYASRISLFLRRDAAGDRCPTFHFSSGRSGSQRQNTVLSAIRALHLADTRSGDKFIPDAYKFGPPAVRLGVLAGLMDTDGSLANRVFDYLTKSPHLAEDVLFVARSLGFAAYQSLKIVDGKTFYRIGISGEVSRIPTRIPRKKAPKRRQKKNVLRTGFHVERIPDAYYYGFTLTGDGRFLLGDFTVTHNTVIAAHLIQRVAEQGGTAHFICDRESLIRQTSERLAEWGLDHGVQQGLNTFGRSRRIQVLSAQTVAARGIILDADVTVNDEGHIVHKAVTSQLVENGKRVVALSATPFRDRPGENLPDRRQCPDDTAACERWVAVPDQDLLR